MTQQPDPAARPAVFVLFGATGDLARRMVLPALYRLACEGLLPRQWLLVGNGRGDITHENFRARVHDALTEFGPKPEGKDWDSFAQRVFFAGGGFSPDSPGSLPDVLGAGARIAGRQPAARALPGRPAGRLRRADAGAGAARAGPRRPGRLREAVRHLAGAASANSTGSFIRSWMSSRCTGSTISWARKPPRICTCCASPTGRRPRTGTASTSSRCRSTCPRRSASATGPSSTTPPARSWTCSSRTCSRWPPRSPWNPRPAWTRWTCRRPGRRSSAASGRWTRGRSCWGSSMGTGRCRVSIRTPAGTRSWPPGCGSTTPAGGTCRSTCAPASGWPPRSSGSA